MKVSFQPNSTEKELMLHSGHVWKSETLRLGMFCFAYCQPNVDLCEGGNGSEAD